MAKAAFVTLFAAALLKRSAAFSYPSFSVLSRYRTFCSNLATRESSKITLTMDSTKKSEAEWRAVLSPQQFAVLREKATERAGSSPLNKLYPESGSFGCVACGTPLYTAKSKFDSGCGWPAFYEGIPGAIKEVPDADGSRVEILCNKCDSHLGHVFKGEGFPTPTNERHCVNGICLSYVPAQK